MLKTLRWRFSLTYFSITALFFTILGFYLINTMVNYSYNRTEEKLISSAWLISDNVKLLIKTDQQPNLQSFVEEKKELIGARVTLIDSKGVVTADSHSDAKALGNHRDRPEFAAALSGEIGKSLRYSSTLNERAIYVAVPITDDDTVVGAVRVSILWDQVQSGVWHIRWVIGTAIFIVFVLTALISSSLAKGITAPLQEMTDVANEMAEGKLDRYVRNISDDEMGALGRGLNYMARRLKDTITEITEEKNKIQAILASMAEGVVAVDKSRRILLVNTAIEKLFEVKAEDVVGGNLIEGVRNYELERIINKALEKGSNINQELELLPQGRTFRVNVVPLKKGDETVGVVAVLRDITEIRDLEKMRSEFVANVSHELRTPLTSIKGFVETLLDGAIDDKEVSMRFLEIINTEANRLTRLINDILSLSAIEANERDIIRTTVSVNELIERVISVLTPLAKEKDLLVEANIAPELPLINADEDMIKQVFMNLIDNAIKYTPSGGTIKISAAPSRSGVKVSIRDTGIGIPAEGMSRLFERFYRVDKARSRELGGTGLGLAIVKHILEVHGGNIRVESQVGKGSKFTFYLPPTSS